jgi:phosphoribosylformimino-5-aminoimidazole carboxamide ribotide isomerase
VIASGGVSSLDDIRRLKDIESDGVGGAIIGRALYEGGLDFREAVKLAQS